MSSIASDGVAYLDPSDPAFSFRSAEVAAAREQSWYARTPYGIAVLRYEEVARLIQDRRLGQGSRRWPAHNGAEGRFNDWWLRSLINLVGDDHARQRRALNPGFSPRLVDTKVPVFQSLANELIDGFIDTGQCEFVSEFSQPYATRVICKLIGVGDDRWQKLAEWTSTMGLALGVTIKQELSRIEDAMDHLTAYADEVIAERRRNPIAGDTVAHLMEVHDAGKLSEQELRETLVNVFFGGVETTRNQLGIAMDLFIRYPDQWALLGERPELAPAAVEEVMRVRPTTTWVTREALESIDFEGVHIPAGTTVHLLTSTIGSDPRKYGQDVQFDITAERPRQYGFGGDRTTASATSSPAATWLRRSFCFRGVSTRPSSTGRLSGCPIAATPDRSRYRSDSSRAREVPETVEQGTLRLCCTSLDSGRLFWTDPDGTRHGYEVEVAEAVARAAGLELQWVFRQWSDFRPALERLECDAIWCGCAITNDRKQLLDFTRPYAVFNESVVTRRDVAVCAPEDLAGLRVLAIDGSTNIALARTFEHAQVVPFAGDTDDVLGDMLNLLRDGEVDAVVDDDVCFIEPDPTLRVAFTVETRNAWGGACRKGDADLVSALDDALQQVDLRGIWARWLSALPCPF